MRLPQIDKKFLKPVLIIKSLVKEIPRLVWVSCACLGIFILGFLVGIQFTNDFLGYAPSSQELMEENIKLKELIGGYEDLNDSYLLQRQDVGVILNKDLVYNDPEEVAAALRSLDQQRDIISVLIGRVLELRKAAGLPELTDFSFDQPDSSN